MVKFIWGKSGHRLARQSLYNLRNKGRLGLPNFFWYYQAARLAQLSTVYSKSTRPDWVEMERQAVPSFTIDFLLWCPPQSRPPILSPSLSQSLRIWDTLRKDPSLVSQSKPLAHIFRNPDFHPGLDIKAFQWWLDRGMYRIGNYFTSAGPISLAHCIKHLDLPISERFRYMQLSHFLHSIWVSKPDPPQFTPYELWCGQLLEQRGDFHNLLLACNKR